MDAVAVDTAGERFLRYVATRDVAILDGLLTEHLDRAFCQARRLLGNTSEAEDAVQEALVLLVRTADRYDGAVPFAAWLGRRVHYAALTVIRLRARRRRHEGRAGRSQSGSFPVRAELDEPTDPSAAIRGVVQELPDEYRALIDLHYFAGLSQRDTGLALGIKENTVAKRLQRARESLRLLLQRRGLTLAGVAIATALSSAPVYSAPAAMFTGMSVISSMGTSSAASMSAVTGGLIGAKTAIAAAAGLALTFGAWTAWPSHPHIQPASGTLQTTHAPYLRTWDFNGPETPDDIAVSKGSWQWEPNGSPDDSGCRKTTAEVTVINFDLGEQGFTRPVMLSAIVSPALPRPDHGFLFGAHWNDARWSVMFNHVSEPITIKESGWSKIQFYITADWIDMWSDGKRSCFITGEPRGSTFCLPIRGTFRVDDIRLEEVSPAELPDVSEFLRVLAEIPEHERSSVLELPAEKSPIPGNPMRVYFNGVDRKR
jgi:RNA polymerase sigma-70 factor, ECF subfamily